MDYVARSPVQLGQIMRNCRKRRDLSQQEAAAKVGLKQSTVSSVELDSNGSSLETLFKLLSALGVSSSSCAIQWRKAAHARPAAGSGDPCPVHRANERFPPGWMNGERVGRPATMRCPPILFPASAGQLSPHKMKLAMAVDGENRHYHWSSILRRHCDKTARRCGIAAFWPRIATELIETTPTVIDAVASELPADFPLALADSIFKGLRKSAAKMSV